jgi:hypothetical protein
MLRAVVPRFRIAREGGIRRAATGYGVAPAFGKGAVSASLLPSMRLGHCGVPGPWIAAAAAVSGTTTAPTHASGHCGGHPTHQRRTPALRR